MPQTILVVTPLQKEYDDLDHSLIDLGLNPHKDKIGKLDVHYFPEINVSLARDRHGKTQFAGDVKSIEQIKGLNLSDADLNVHFGIMAGGDEDVIDIQRGRELRELWDELAVAWEGIGGARASAFSDLPYLEIRGATDTADHEAPVVSYINLKIVYSFCALQVAERVIAAFRIHFPILQVINDLKMMADRCNQFIFVEISII
jgi:nucleoside phosphorylase